MTMGCRVVCLVALWLLPAVEAFGAVCPETEPGVKNIYWGDLHVHSSFSLDGWGYGTKTTPEQAYNFAKGSSVVLAHGKEVKLERPLDFMALTDHAEWFNLMYACTDPLNDDDPYCNILTEKNTPALGGQVFAEYVLPTITKAEPAPTPLCAEHEALCREAHLTQWQRVQDHANAANDPCKFTSFIAYEWSATPDFSHNHRNVIFSTGQVPDDAYDYMRFPTPEALWQQLDSNCRQEEGCDVVLIPHNTNMGDGKSFDVETESPDTLALRARYERLVEIHQEKGNSECLPAFGQTDEDCGFEPYYTQNSRLQNAADFTPEAWERMRGSYVRRLLLRGLYAYETSERTLNPLQLGIIGSTDNHAGTGGFTDEATWPGSVFGLGNFERAMARQNWNPGGLVAVWAEENTRASIFAALHRREVYATSGPRMRVRMLADNQPLTCESTPSDKTVMGGEIGTGEALYLRVDAEGDKMPLSSIEVIRGELSENGEMIETVFPLWEDAEGMHAKCVIWQDRSYNPTRPAFWYARVKEVPTPRWTAYRCERAGLCADYPGADEWMQERAWTSPIWRHP